MTVQPTRDQLRALADRATPGPWLPHARYVWTSELGGIIQNWSEDANAAADMELVATARNAMPALLDMLDRAEAEVKRLSWKCGHLADKYAQDTDELRQEVDQAEARIQAVRELHHHDVFRGHLDNGCAICGHEWPCPTIRALDGEQ